MTKNRIDVTTIDPKTGEEVIGSKSATNIANIFFRMVAVFAASGLSIIGAGSLVGIETMTAVIMAGTLGVATVTEKLARAFLDDGKLSANEINSAFSSVDKKAE
jgi:hypothetical protein